MQFINVARASVVSVLIILALQSYAHARLLVSPTDQALSQQIPQDITSLTDSANSPITNNHFKQVKNYLIRLGFAIKSEEQNDGIIVIGIENDGANVVFAITPPLLIVESMLLNLDVVVPLTTSQ